MKRIVFTLILGCLAVQLMAQDALRTARDYSEQGEYAKSASLLENFIGTHPDRKYDVARAWWLQSYNLLQLGDQEAARKANDKSLSLRMDLRSSAVVENYLREAQISFQAGDAQGALAAVRQGSQMLVEDPLIYADLNLYAAKALTQLSNYDEANDYYQIAKEVIAIELGTDNPAYGELLYAGGQLQLKQRDYLAAFDSFSAAYYLLADPVERAKCLVLAKQVHAIANRSWPEF